MALVQLHGRANDPQTRQLLAAQLIGQGLSGFGQAMQGQKERDALGALLAGKAGPGLSQITQQGAPGLNPALAGPSRAMTSGQMAQPGMMHTGGQMTPQMAQAFMLQGGNPEQLASLMPKQMTPYETAQVDIERQKLAQPAGPQSGIGKIVADMGGDPTNPADLARAAEIMKSTQAGTNVSVKMPASYPAAPEGYHYAGDYGSGQAQLVPTPGYTPDIPAEAAKDLALVPGVIEDMSAARSAIVSPDGKINRSLIAQMWGNVPGTTGRGLRGKYEAALDWVTSKRTGASATPDQKEAYKSAFRPHPLDPDSVIMEKMAALERDALAAMQVALQGRGEVPPPPQAGMSQEPAPPTWMDKAVGGITGAIEQGVEAFTGGGPPAPGAPAQAGPAQPPQSPQIGEGSIATNPSTGQSLILRNGQWVPL